MRQVNLRWIDANSTQAKCLSELKKETEAHPQFANYDDLGGNEQPAAASGTDTPGPVATPKLKLTFNSGNRDSMGPTSGSGVNEDE